MAKYGSDSVAFFLVGGYSLLGYQTEIGIGPKEKTTEETHTLGDAWIEHSLVGLSRSRITQRGFYDDEANGNNVALLANVGTANVLAVGVEGNTIGKKFSGYSGAMQTNYERIATRGELHKATAEHLCSGPMEEGVILHDLSAETAASGDTEGVDSVDSGASSAAGGSGYLEVSALTLGGYTSVTVKIRHSNDDVTYADLITFTVVTAAPSAERKTVAGTINRYLAHSWLFNGAGTGQSITYMVGLVRS